MPCEGECAVDEREEVSGCGDFFVDCFASLAMTLGGTAMTLFAMTLGGTAMTLFAMTDRDKIEAGLGESCWAVKLIRHAVRSCDQRAVPERQM